MTMKKIYDITSPQIQPVAIQQAIDVLNSGGVVIFPTDTVYGLAASAFNEGAIQRLYRMKERDPQKSIAVLLGNISQIRLIAADFPESARKLAERYWPGGLTLLVSKLDTLPPALSANEKIGIRIPDYPVIQDLIIHTGPLATTSANLSGEPPAKKLSDLPDSLLRQADLILDGGPVKGGIASTVVDCTVRPLLVLREGAISKKEVAAFDSETE